MSSVGRFWLCSGIAIGTALQFVYSNSDSTQLFAKAKPQKNYHKVILKGYCYHPLIVKYSTILEYYGINQEAKEYNSMDNEKIYRNLPIVVFMENPTSWFIVKGDDNTIEYITSKVINNPMTHIEKEWHSFARDRLTPALEYMMWRSPITAFQTTQYYRSIDYIPIFRRYLHTAVVVVTFPFKKRRYLRKSAGMNDESCDKIIRQLHDKIERAPGPFIGGKKPNISDLEIYGILQSARGLPLESKLFENADEKFIKWNDIMKKEVYGDNLELFNDRTYYHKKGQHAKLIWPSAQP